MAISTYKAFLMSKSTSSSTYSKLCDIKGIPATGGAPENIDVTTTSDSMRKYIPGIIETQAMEFKANYDKTLYQTLKGMEGTETDFAIWFGGTVDTLSGTVTPTGTDGQLSFSGKLTAWTDAADINSAVEIVMSIAVSSEIAFSVGT